MTSNPLPATAVAVAAAFLLHASAHAGPSQATVDVPGGFATACASEISSGGTFTPGLDLERLFEARPGQSACQSRVFSGANGTASAAAAWSTASVQNESAITVRMGSIGFAARNVSPQNVQFPVGVAGGGWSESMIVDLAGHTGESAVWLFTVGVQGMLSAGSNGSPQVQMNAYKDERELVAGVPGFDRGDSARITTDRQRVQWFAPRNSELQIDDQITFAVPVTLGQSFVWGVYGTVRASIVAFSFSTPPTASHAEADFLHTLRYGGSAGLLLGGVPVEGYTLSAASGIDWTAATPVPEPGALAMWAAGLATLAGLVRRRRS